MFGLQDQLLTNLSHDNDDGDDDNTLGDEDGDVVIMAHSKEMQVLAEMNMGGAVYGTVVPAHGTLFLNNRSQLFAIAAE